MSTSKLLAIFSLASLLFGCASPHPRIAMSSSEPSWSDVPLEGMHLRLSSPKSRDHSEDLYFGKGGSLAVTTCSGGACTNPLIVWKIEGNRLKTGFSPDDGDTLVEYRPDRISMRKPDGRILVYAIIAN